MIGLLGSLLGGRGGRMIGTIIGGRTGGMIGGLAGAMLGGTQLRSLGRMVSNRGGAQSQSASDPAPPGLDEDQAQVLILAMCNAAKADGHVDSAETEQIVSELDDISPSERQFLEDTLRSPMVSAEEMALSVPADLKAEAYAVSLIAINVDTMEEASYLEALAAELDLSDNDRDNIHDDLGVDRLP